MRILLALLAALVAASPALAQKVTPDYVPGCVYYAVTPTLANAQPYVQLCDPSGNLLVKQGALPADATATATITTATTLPATVAVNTNGAGSATFTLTGTFTGLQATIQGLSFGAGPSGWVTIPNWQVTTGAGMPQANSENATVNAANTWQVNTTGYSQVRLNVTALSTGSMNVFADAGAGAPQYSWTYLVGANGFPIGSFNNPLDSTSANNGVLEVAGFNLAFNGATWDRLRTLGSGTGIAAVDLAPSSNAAVGITPTPSGSAVASLVLKASPGNFYSGTAVNATATGGFCLVINATSAPTTGSAVTPLEFAVLPASGQCSIVRSPPDVFSTGIVFLVSNNASPFTFTSGTITAAISGQVQ